MQPEQVTIIVDAVSLREFANEVLVGLAVFLFLTVTASRLFDWLYPKWMKWRGYRHF